MSDIYAEDCQVEVLMDWDNTENEVNGWQESLLNIAEA